MLSVTIKKNIGAKNHEINYCCFVRDRYFNYISLVICEWLLRQ